MLIRWWSRCAQRANSPGHCSKVKLALAAPTLAQKPHRARDVEQRRRQRRASRSTARREVGVEVEERNGEYSGAPHGRPDECSYTDGRRSVTAYLNDRGSC